MCQAGFVEICAGFCVRYVFCQSRLSRDLHKDVKDLGCWNSDTDEACWAQQALCKSSAPAECSCALVQGPAEPVPREPAHLECRRSWAPAAVELVSSLGGGCSFTSQLAKFSWGGVSTVCLAAQAVSRAELTQPLHLRKVVWALGLYEHTGFSWINALLLIMMVSYCTKR